MMRFGLLLLLLLACSRTETAPIAADGDERDGNGAAGVASAVPVALLRDAGALPTDASSDAVRVTTGTDAGTGPLRTWMKRELGPTFASRKLPETAQLLDKVAGAKPSGMPNWQSIAKDGAAAARSGNVEATKAACRGCHDQYKAKYIEQQRALPFP